MVRLVRKRPLPLPQWIEATIRLPRGVAAEPGPIKLYPYQRGIADARLPIRGLSASPS
jgi:hypothetical protein